VYKGRRISSESERVGNMQIGLKENWKKKVDRWYSVLTRPFYLLFQVMPCSITAAARLQILLLKIFIKNRKRNEI
jgi:hypothetical protein